MPRTVKTTLLVSTLGLLACARHAAPAAPAGSRALDLGSEAGRALAFLLVRGSTDPEEEVFFHWTGEVFAVVPAEAHGEARPRRLADPILRIEGYNVARFLPEGRRVRMVSREVTFFVDADGAPLDCWPNPFTGEEVPVVHVWNDPVAFELGAPPATDLGDQVVFSVGLSLEYPSPLPVVEFPDTSAGNTYQSTELFDFFASRADLTDPRTTSVPATFAWTRVSQWLPWMRMGQRPGWLVFHARGRKLVGGGLHALPEPLRRAVLDRDARFAHAPTSTESPNATSWTRFRDLSEAGAIQRHCPGGAAGP